jgi:hypothetical protein
VLPSVAARAVFAHVRSLLTLLAANVYMHEIHEFQ